MAPIRLRRIALLLAVAIWTTLALAQSYPPRIGPLATDSDRLDAAAIERAAGDLGALGVDALALFVEAPIGATLDAAERYFEGALVRYGLAPDQSYLIVFVGTAELSVDGVRPLFVEVGGGLERRLDDPLFADVLRNGVVAPRLASGDLSGAFVSAFEATVEALAPTPAAGSEPAPVTPSRPADEPSGPGLALQLGLALLVVGLIAVLLRRRRGAAAGATEDGELQRVQGELSQRLIELSGGGAGASALPADPEQHTDFVLIRGLLRGTDPERLERLEARYREESARLRGVEQGFEALRASTDPPTRRLERARSLLMEAEGVGAFVAELAALWGELQREAAAVPELLAGLRTRSDALRDRLTERFAGRTDAEAVLAGVAALIERAESEASDGGVDAAETADAAESELSRIEADAAALADADARLSELDVRLGSWSAEGFVMEPWRRRIEAERGRVESALTSLVEPDADGTAAAAEGVERLAAELEGLVQTQRENAVRLAELEQRGRGMPELIERGAVAFDAVDDFAEANWRDIRGNGSEAQAAAERAEDLVERAAILNALEGTPEREGAEGELQDIAAAAAVLDDAERELDRAEALVTAIAERLEALRSAQGTARRQLEAVEQELAAQRALLAAPEIDREVGEGPEAALVEGERLAAEARALLAAERPDWLGAHAAIQRADAAVDAAAAAVRGEREAIERLRLRLASERDEARAAAARSEHYLRVHAADLSPDTIATGAAATELLRSASELELRSERASDIELATLLESAATAFDRAQTEADRAFEVAEAEVAAAEELRREAAAGVAEVASDLDSFGSYLRRHGLAGDLSRLLFDLQRSLPATSGLGPSRLAGIGGELEAARRELTRLRAEAERQVERRESALRRERQQRLERERRRRAAELARQQASWGGSSWAGGASSSPRSRPPKSKSRIPTVSRPKPAPKPRPASARRSGGGWSGPKRSKGGW